MTVGLEVVEPTLQASALLAFEYSCENHPRRIKFLSLNSKSRLLFLDMYELGNPTSSTLRHGKCAVPKIEVASGGFICRPRSKANAKRKQYRESYSSGKGESGESLQCELDVIRKQDDAVVLFLENVACPSLSRLLAQLFFFDYVSTLH